MSDTVEVEQWCVIVTQLIWWHWVVLVRARQCKKGWMAYQIAGSTVKELGGDIGVG